MQFDESRHTPIANKPRSAAAIDARADYGGSFAIVSDLREYFDACDNDRDGRIQYDGFLVLLSYLGTRANPECCRWFRNMDTDNDGSIDIHQFVAGWMA